MTSWDHLDESNEKITLKGFLVQSGDNWFLCKAPNVKSCCISKTESKIFLPHLEDHFKKDKVYTLKGYLKKVPGNRAEFQMEQLEFIKTSTQILYPIPLLFFLLLISVFFVKRRKKL